VVCTQSSPMQRFVRESVFVDRRLRTICYIMLSTERFRISSSAPRHLSAPEQAPASKALRLSVNDALDFSSVKPRCAHHTALSTEGQQITAALPNPGDDRNSLVWQGRTLSSGALSQSSSVELAGNAATGLKARVMAASRRKQRLKMPCANWGSPSRTRITVPSWLSGA
jgi:hypothetical protein